MAQIIESPLQQTYSQGDKSVDILIYKTKVSKGWTLEIVDEYDNSWLWDDEFITDQAALAEALADLKHEGIKAFIGPDLTKAVPPVKVKTPPNAAKNPAKKPGKR